MSRSLLLHASICCLSLGLGGLASAGEREEWVRDQPLSAAVAEAAAGGRRVLVLLDADEGARGAQVLERLAAEPLAAKVSAYVRRVYSTTAGEGRHVAQRYNVVAVPTLLLLDRKGLELGRLTGSEAPAGTFPVEGDLLSLLDGEDPLRQLETQLEHNGGDLALRLEVGCQQALRGHARQAKRHLEAVIAADARDARGLASRALLCLGDTLQLRSLGDARAAARSLELLRARYPRAAAARAAVLPLARAWAENGDWARLRRSIDGWAKSARQHLAAARLALDHPALTSWAIRHAHRAAALAPTEPDARRVLALLELELDHPLAAQQSLRSTSLAH